MFGAFFLVCLFVVPFFQGRAAILCSAACVYNTRSPKETEREGEYNMTTLYSHVVPLLYTWFSPLPIVHSQLFPLF